MALPQKHANTLELEILAELCFQENGELLRMAVSPMCSAGVEHLLPN